MIDFWLPAGLLLLAALAFLLIPVLRVRKLQPEEDRTALNVTLYQERIGELEQQHANGVLDAAGLEAGRSEAARELLSDTENAPKGRGTLGMVLPLIVALLVPVTGLGLYLHWGALEKVEEARVLAQAQPQNLEQMIASLQEATKRDPQSPQAWYFLGRAYMAQERPAEAAEAFAQAVEKAGRAPELLGQLAQARYFAGGKVWTDELQALTDEALKADPQEATSLGLLGIAAYEREAYDEAVKYWQRLVAILPPEDPSRQAIEGGIERARQLAGEDASQQASASQVQLHVQVSLGEAAKGQVKPDDTVFIFARAISGPPMPLAVKRVTVAQLPLKVSLSDADAMMPELKLSRFDQVQLVARISRDGDATRGQWQGQSPAISSRSSEVHTLVIDQPETP